MVLLRRLGVSVLGVLGPFMLRPERLSHPAVCVVLAATLLIQLTLPRASVKDMRCAAAEDKGSAALILIVGNLVGLVAVLDFVLRPQLAPAAASAWVVCGAACLASGVALRVWAMRVLGPAFTGVVDSSASPVLETRGPYRVLRHPSYAGVLLALVGEASAFHSAIGLGLTLAAMLPVYLFRIRHEERALVGHFGTAYDEYRARTSALVPFIF